MIDPDLQNTMLQVIQLPGPGWKSESDNVEDKVNTEKLAGQESPLQNSPGDDLSLNENASLFYENAPGFDSIFGEVNSTRGPSPRDSPPLASVEGNAAAAAEAPSDSVSVLNFTPETAVATESVAAPSASSASSSTLRRRRISRSDLN